MTMTETSAAAPVQTAPKLEAITRTSSRGGFVAEVTIPAVPGRAAVKVVSQPMSTRETALADLRMELRRYGIRL